MHKNQMFLCFAGALVGLLIAVYIGTLEFSFRLPTFGVATFMTPPVITAEFTKLLMSFVISIIVLAASLNVIASKNASPENSKWAFGTVGTVLGFWIG